MKKSSKSVSRATRRPLVIAYHLIFTAYGSWLPNDPRGSSSHLIRNDVIADLGELHHGRKNVQPCSEVIRGFYREADKRLQFERGTFTADERSVIGKAFEECAQENRYTCWACAVMWDHVHLLIRKHRDQAEEMLGQFQTRSRERLVAWSRARGGLARFGATGHPVWGGRGWKVFLDHPDEVRRTINYIERNPIKADERSQSWDFVQAYNDWPLHPGHSERSPYVRALKAAGRYRVS